MEPAGADNRQYQRHDFATIAWFKRVDDATSGSDEGVARSCDISSRGVGVVTTRKLPVGASVFLEIAAPEGRVSVVAEVMHCSAAESGCYRIGLRVYCVPPSDRAAWQRMLAE